MMSHQTLPRRRQRRSGILSAEGWQRLLDTKESLECRENGGYAFTLAELSLRTTLSVNTLTKIFARKVAVDVQTLACCFRAFGLELREVDYFKPSCPLLRQPPAIAPPFPSTWEEAAAIPILVELNPEA